MGENSIPITCQSLSFSRDLNLLTKTIFLTAKHYMKSLSISKAWLSLVEGVSLNFITVVLTERVDAAFYNALSLNIHPFDPQIRLDDAFDNMGCLDYYNNARPCR